ncbi:MAG: hypothetical protein EHM93_14920 [Bacteroidales bacterium]|nr:MAG: hypothetical protein EHM93_14920 [Bacteroidales bacterium]
MKKGQALLFNDISISDISSTFTGIDEQIIDLHKCSSDDFLGLSTDFKKFYNQSKGIADNANEIFNLLSEKSNRNLFVELQTLYKDLKKIQSHSHQNLSTINTNLSLIKSYLEQLFIPIKNLKQNLSTLKFLIANINLNDLDYNEKKNINWVGMLNGNSNSLNEYRVSCLSSEQLIIALESEISRILNGQESFTHTNSNDFENLLNNIHYTIIFFAEKHEEVKLQIPELTSKTENSSKNISDIITNLQYQDIIRQKIEHIQKSHSKILPELQELYDRECSDSVKESQIFQKVKDIAGLQAAILVSANKEYQLAIEKITSRFLEIGDDMIGITSICTRLNSSQENTEDLQLAVMLNRLNNSEQILSNFIERSNSYHKQIKTISIPLNSVANSLVKLIESSKCYSESSNIIANISESINIKSNLDEVYKDIHQFEVVIQRILNDILNIESEFIVRVKQLDESVINNETVKKAGDSINSILKQVENKGDSINQLLDHIKNQSSNSVLEIKDSIKRIRYYDFFEKSITSIISDLNHIHIKLSGADYDKSNRSENLKSIKSLYTMETEHKIHDRIVFQSDHELLIEDEREKGKNSDEVELF